MRTRHCRGKGGFTYRDWAKYNIVVDHIDLA